MKTYLLILALALPLVAQNIQAFHYQTGGPDHVGAAFAQHGNTFEFVGAEMFAGKVVKGAPYSAEAVTETTQNLANGNRIYRKSSTLMYRDGEGRTRREQSIGPIGPLGHSAEPIRFINIYDPVANVSYTLDPKNHTARKMTVITEHKDGAGWTVRSEGGGTVQFMTSSNDNATVTVNKMVTKERTAAGAGQKESLGKSVLEGVNAEGTRSTITIPAGQIGNDLPIDIVTENWYSPELQAVVMTKTSDPRFGDTVYRLTNINRSEPAHSLFEVPSDYNTVMEDHTGVQIRKMKKDM